MELQLNLARKPYLNRRKTSLWLLLGCTILLLLLAVNLRYVSEAQRQTEILDSRFKELDEQLAEIQGGEVRFTPEAYQKLLTEVASANRILAADSFRWTALLGRFEELIPSDASIHSLQPNFDTRTLSVVGVSRDVDAMNNFIDRLLASKDLSKVFLLSQRYNPGVSGSSGSVSFSLEIREAF